MLSSNAVQTQFVTAVLCPAADYSDLLAEAKRRKLVILEMIPFSKYFADHRRYIDAKTAVLFVCGKNKAFLAEQEADFQKVPQFCNCPS